MKKLIITALAVVGLGITANASQAVWGNFFGAYEDSNGDAFTGGSALLYALSGDASTAVAFNNGWNLNGATLVGTATYSAGDEGWGTLDYADLGSGVNAGTNAGDAMQYFTLIVTEKSGVTSIDSYDGNYVAWTAQGSQAVVDPTGPTYGVDITMYNDIAKGDWQSAAAVPEPTSGLLLLLGVAGLALKRKRA